MKRIFVFWLAFCVALAAGLMFVPAYATETAQETAQTAEEQTTNETAGIEETASQSLETATETIPETETEESTDGYTTMEWLHKIVADHIKDWAKILESVGMTVLAVVGGLLLRLLKKTIQSIHGTLNAAAKIAKDDKKEIEALTQQVAEYCQRLSESEKITGEYREMADEYKRELLAAVQGGAKKDEQLKESVLLMAGIVENLLTMSDIPNDSRSKLYIDYHSAVEKIEKMGGEKDAENPEQ